VSAQVHPNSIEAYHSQEAKLSARAEAVLAWIRFHGRATDRQVAYGMGFGENLNAVRPRITELIDAGLLRETHNVRCHVTGKTVRVVDLPAGQEALFS
jgi:hypothetical protein